jgi:hypothetical protein
MKAHYKRMRVLRGLAIAGCLAGLGAPSVAGAMPLPADPPTPVLHPHGRPTIATQDRYSLPSTFKADVWAQATARKQSVDARYVLPASHQTDTQVAPTAASTSQTSSPVVREIRTFTNNGGHTLAIVLAACALGIALCGTGYAAVRLTQLQRRVIGSSS